MQHTGCFCLQVIVSGLPMTLTTWPWICCRCTRRTAVCTPATPGTRTARPSPRPPSRYSVSTPPPCVFCTFPPYRPYVLGWSDLALFFDFRNLDTFLLIGYNFRRSIQKNHNFALPQVKVAVSRNLLTIFYFNNPAHLGD